MLNHGTLGTIGGVGRGRVAHQSVFRAGTRILSRSNQGREGILGPAGSVFRRFRPFRFRPPWFRWFRWSRWSRWLTILLLTYTPAAFSAPLTGGPYSLHPYALNGGGEPASSASYDLNASLAEEGGNGTSSSASYSAEYGFWPGGLINGTPPTPTSTSTATFTATLTAIPTVTRTATFSRTATGTRTQTATMTQTPTATEFGVPTSTVTQSPTASPTSTTSPSPTPSVTATPTETTTETEDPSETETPTLSETASATPTLTSTPDGPTSTPTASPTMTEIPRLLDVIPDDTITLGPGLARFAFTFSVPMNQGESPTVSYGKVFPFALGTILADPGWVNNFTWIGVTELAEFLPDGLYTLRVRNAETQDGAIVPEDSTHQFRFLKQSPDDLTNGRVTDEATNALAMEWDRSGSPGVSGHIIGSAPRAEGPYDVVAAAGSAEDAFVHLGLTSDTSYFYRVYEVFLNKGNGTDVRQLTNTFDGRTLARLANGRAEALSQTQMRVTWESDNDPSTLGFQVRRAANREQLGDCGENPGTIIEEVSPPTNEATDEGLQSNSVYYYDICLVDDQGNTTRLENTFAGRTLGMDSNGDGMVDVEDLLWILNAARQDKNAQDVLIEFSLEWNTSAE